MPPTSVERFFASSFSSLLFADLKMSATSNPRDVRPVRKAGLPAGTLSLAQPKDSLVALLTRQEHFTKLATLLLLGETVLCLLVIHFVPCTCSPALSGSGLSRGRRGACAG